MNRALLVALAAVSAACGREDISVRHEAKSAPMAMESVAEAPAAAPAGVRWTTPKGWTQKAGGNMRVAAFDLPAPSDKAEATVATFPGDVGGELANVNRWRGQLSLPPIEESALAGLRSRVKSRAGEILLYDFVGPGDAKTRLVAGMVRVGDATWFFKLLGPEAAVAAARPAFIGLLEGLRRDSL